ncbi:MAG: DmsE family decaheme c-type cytochrome [Nitrospinae bacterium]|nr:DmsE family decaheme c-type cytochrome [Nitrospinota bacterium]
MPRCLGRLAFIALLMGAAAGVLWAPPGADAATAQDCRLCHEDFFESFSETMHGKVLLHNPRNDMQAKGCEACHGPGEAHMADAKDGRGNDLAKITSFKKHSPLTAAQKNEVCLGCHTNDDYKMYWKGSQHQSNGVACVDCHTIMKKTGKTRQMAKGTVEDTCFQCHTQRKAQFQRTNHMPFREGKMTCTNCHNPHGSAGQRLLVGLTVNETCYTCHMEKRGPFLWEHAPVRENCTNCHDPHGTNNHKALKAKIPFLCQRCHANTNHPSNAYTDPRAVDANGAYVTTGTGQFMYNRGCLNCHQQIHGSNSPSGPRFHR